MKKKFCMRWLSYAFFVHIEKTRQLYNLFCLKKEIVIFGNLYLTYMQKFMKKELNKVYFEKNTIMTMPKSFKKITFFSNFNCNFRL